jgi:hypothetical protein
MKSRNFRITVKFVPMNKVVAVFSRWLTPRVSPAEQITQSLNLNFLVDHHSFPSPYITDIAQSGSIRWPRRMMAGAWDWTIRRTRNNSLANPLMASSWIS